MMSSISEIQTPCFVYDERQLEANFNHFRDAFSQNWCSDKLVFGYSVKTAPIKGLISLAVDHGYWIEVVSDDEYDLALKAGCPPAKVIFNGPIKSKEWLFFAYRTGAMVNLDSNKELQWTVEYAKTYGVQPKVGLRFNFDLEKRCPSESSAGCEEPRFGFCVENGCLGDAIAILRSVDVEPVGLHGHFSSESHSTGVYEAIANEVCSIANAYELKSLEYIDMGGGYYGGGTNCWMYSKYAESITSVLKRQFDSSSITLVLEPGGSVLCTPGSYFGKIIDVKNIRDTYFVVTELSKLNINPTNFSRRSYSMEYYGDRGGSVVNKQVICGYTCMEMDRFSTLIDEPLLQVGGVLEVKNAGAYSTSFAPRFFIQSPPAVYLRRESGTYLLLNDMRKPKAPVD